MTRLVKITKRGPDKSTGIDYFSTACHFGGPFAERPIHIRLSDSNAAEYGGYRLELSLADAKKLLDHLTRYVTRLKEES